MKTKLSSRELRQRNWSKVFSNLLKKVSKNCIIMVAQKFKIFQTPKQMKKSGFARHTLSNINLHSTLQSARQYCSETRYCSTWRCKFCIVIFIVCIYVFISITTNGKFCITHFWQLERTSSMIDQKDNINVDKIVIHDSNQGKKSPAGLKQTCSRSLFLLLYQLFVFLLSVFVFLGVLQNYSFKTSDESTACAGFFVKSAGHFLFSS